MQHLIVSFLSPDRPGLVDSLSQIVKQHQGNWQVSSMHRLSGFFAGVVEIAIAPANLEALQQALQDMPEVQLQMAVANTQITDDRAKVVLELTANDRAGIVQDISSMIHKQGGNLIKLVSKQDIAPHTGQVIFKAKATVLVDKASHEPLISALETLADDLMVDIVKK
jgi:glycine cleavage system regulatory protein